MLRATRLTWLWTGVAILAAWTGTAGRAAAATEAQAWAELAQALETAPAEEGTAKLALQFLDRFPVSQFRLAAEYGAGETFFQRRDYAQARRYYQAAQENGAAEFADSALFRIGECFWNAGDAGQAEATWLNLLSRYPESPLRPEAEAASCRLLLRQERYDQAAEKYRDLLARYPLYRADRNVRTGLARIDLARGQSLEAFRRLARLNTSEALYLQGRSLLNLQRKEETAEMLAIGSQEAGDGAERARVKAYLAWSLFAGGSDAAALAGIQHTLADPNLPPAAAADLRLLRIVCLINLNYYDAAAEAATGMLKLPANRAVGYLHYLQGLVYYRLQRRALAQQIWKDALAAEGGEAGRKLLLDVVDTLVAGGDYEPARGYCQLYVQRHAQEPGVGEIHQRLAQIYYRLGRDSEAVAAYREYLRSAPPVPPTPQPSSAAPTAEGRLRTENQAVLVAMRGRLELLGAPYARLEIPSASRKTASPWLQLLSKPPVLQIRIPDSPAATASWTFLVTDAAGRRIYVRQAGQGRLPEVLNWDGLGQDGRRLQVGETFRYAVVLKDQNGKTLAESTQPGQLTAQVYPRAEGACVSLLAAALFGPSGTALTPVGRSFLKAAGDELLRQPGLKIRIEMAAPDAKTALSRSEAVRNFLGERLNWPEDAWEPQMPQAGNTDRVELTRMQ